MNITRRGFFGALLVGAAAAKVVDTVVEAKTHSPWIASGMVQAVDFGYGDDVTVVTLHGRDNYIARWETFYKEAVIKRV